MLYGIIILKTLNLGDMMKLKQVWLITQMTFVMLTIFFVTFIPSMAGVFGFIIFLAQSDVIISMVLLPVFSFGALFVCLAVAFKFTFYYNELFDWEKKYENLGDG